MAKITVSPFEKTIDGHDTKLYTIKNNKGASLVLTDYGASIYSINVFDKTGNLKDVVLAYNHISGYETGDTYFGQTVGRCANRIAKGCFNLNGKTYRLNINNGENHLHGGIKSFSKRVWNTKINADSITFSTVSDDNEENYPGKMEVKVTYSFSEDNIVDIEYEAVSDKDTICNITNHSYFNLDGHETNSIYDQYIKINSDKYLPIDVNSIPTGENLSVKNTPFDFTSYKKIGDCFIKGNKQLDIANGFDHTFPLEKSSKLKIAASAYSEKSGIKFECKTTQLGLHLYTGNYVDVSEGKDGTSYLNRSGFSFEAQNYPDAINHENFPNVVLKAKEKYSQKIQFAFSRL
ncbi:aldose epimerase family protein [Clostridium sp. BJN0001]|uniref:aldose epimerase family protein n=1 Tax=Clostridium sp. BJN0001 TaxID=2930219 RepID=UPI001FD0A3C0|nr:aldose epimerase family protein [Clostridium sp. BJN0001]